MKTRITIIGIVLAIFLSGCSSQKPQETQKQTVVKSGKVMAVKGDDYTHLLINQTENIKLNSYTIKLSYFEGKTIEVTGEYSGNTLFVDSVK